MANFKVKTIPLLIVCILAGSIFGLRYAYNNGLLIKHTADVNPIAEAEAAVIAQSEPTGTVVPTQPAVTTASVRFCGSNTIGAELAPALAEQFLKTKGGQRVRKDPTTVSGLLAGEPFVVSVQSAGTGTAFQEMAAGRCDVAMASREVSAEERSFLGDGLVEHVLGLDGIAIITHPSNPINNLTIAQAGSLFAGATPSSIGPVQIVSYDEKSGTYDTFKKLVLGLGEVPRSALKFSDSSKVVQAVASSPQAIGYTSLSSAKGVKILAIGEPGIEPVIPTVWTIVRESYPLTRRLYLYTHSKLTRPSADSLVLYALSNAGQDVVAKSGFVDLAIKAEPPMGCDGCAAPYMQATYGNQRLSVDFRFQNGSSNLDSRASQDSDRVAAFLKPTSKVTLIGFADNSGSPANNQRLSLERAEKVKAELVKHGLTNITTQGMGSLMPTASNLSEEGRQKNRRVEIWTH